MRKYLLILILSVIALAACGRDDYIEEEPTVHQLAVFTHENFRHVVRQAADDIAAAWEIAHPTRIFDLTLSTYNFDNMHAEHMRLRSMLSAGQGYDVIFGSVLTDAANTDYLLNIYSLIDTDRFVNPDIFTLDRSDFHQNALTAREINGRLYALPLMFGFNYVSINTSLPQPVIDRFTASNTISFVDLMHLYLDIRYVYDYEFSNMYFMANFWSGQHAASVLRAHIDSFVDFTNRTTNFASDEFMQLLSLIYDVYSRPVTTGVIRLSGPLRCFDITLAYDNYAFIVDDARLSPALAFADSSLYRPEALVFYHGRPLANSNGQLFLSSGIWPSGNVSFASTGNSDLAWEFTRHLMQAFIEPRGQALNEARMYYGPYIMATPILRDKFTPHIYAAVGRANQERNAFTLRGPLLRTYIPRLCEDTFGGILARLDGYNQMPMTTLHTLIPLYLGPMDAFMAGEISAEEFVRELELTVERWMQQ